MDTKDEVNVKVNYFNQVYICFYYSIEIKI